MGDLVWMYWERDKSLLASNFESHFPLLNAISRKAYCGLDAKLPAFLILTLHVGKWSEGQGISNQTIGDGLEAVERSKCPAHVRK
jgi:hypothetical protein